MPFQISLPRLIQLTNQFTFSKDGDLNEKDYATLAFPNCEKFWKKIVTPITNRITGGGDSATSARVDFNYARIYDPQNNEASKYIDLCNEMLEQDEGFFNS